MKGSSVKQSIRCRKWTIGLLFSLGMAAQVFAQNPADAKASKAVRKLYAVGHDRKVPLVNGL